MIDEKQVVYSKESLVDITTDKSISETGTVTIAGGQITLGPKSSVSYEYNYEAGQDSSIITDILQLDCSVIGLTDGMTTRYNRYLNILIKVQYYLEVVENGEKTYYDGNIDTFEIYPYLSHESNNTLYNIALQNSYIKQVTITYKNDYESDSVKYTDIKLKYSMSLIEAIDKYGGGSTFVPGSNSLKFYSVDDKYSIDSYGDSLIMKIDIDESNWEDVIKPYIKYEETIYNKYTMYYDSDGLNRNFVIYNPVQSYTAKVRWTVRSKSNNTSAFSTMVYGDEQIVYVKEARDLSDEEKERLRSVTGSVYDREYNRILNSGDACFEMKVNLEGRYCKIVGYQTDTLIVRAEYIDAPNIYFEQEVKINNCSVVDFKLTFDDNDMEIHGSDIQFATLEVIPSNIKTHNQNSYAVNLSCISYDEMNGQASIIDDNGAEKSSLSYLTLPARVKVRGRNNGKVLFTAVSDKLYPSNFSKSWIAEVFDVEGIKIWIDGPEKITSNTDIYNYTIKNSQGLNMRIGGTTSNWSYESIDGGSIEYTTIQYDSSKPEIGFSIRANTNGKVVLKIILEIVNTGVSYTITKEVNINIDGLDTTKLNAYSSTGSFIIDKASGEFLLNINPNYSGYGNVYVSVASLDGGSIGLSSDRIPCKVTADKEGHAQLILTPQFGNAETIEVEVQNQYTRDVQLTTPDNVDMIVTGGQLTVNGTPGRPYNNNFYRFNWAIDKINPEVDYSTNNEYYYTTITGKGLGLIRVNCYNYYTGEFLASRIFKIVQSIGSIAIELPYPDTKANWVLFRRRDANSKLFLGTLNGEVTKCTYSGASIDYDVTMTQFSQYYINTDGKTWKNQGNWTNDKNMTGQATELIASSVNVYDSNDNLIMPATQYETIDFANIIYGAYAQRSVDLKTDKDTIYTNDEVKVEAINSDDTVAYDWQFVGTDVTVIEKTNRYVIFKSTSSGDLKVNYILSESGNIITGTDFKVIDKPTNLKYIRLYITKAYRDDSSVDYCNLSELDILDSNGDSVLTDECVYTADSVYSGSSDVPANAFDKNTRTTWHSADNSNAHWIQIEFASGIDLPSSYVITRRTDSWNDYLASWELQGSTDGNNWLTLDKHTDDTNWSSGYSRTFSL